MSWESWGPAIISSGVVTIAGLAGGYFLKAFVEKGVQHGFDRQIEQLKSEIRSKEEDIKSLRAGALANMAAHHEELDRRRITAAENLWAATVFERRFEMITSFMAILNISALEKAFESQEAEMKLFMETVWQASAIDKLLQEQRPLADSERLFVPPRAWMAYEALRTIGSRAVALAGILRAGMGTDVLKKSDESNALIKSVLPHQSGYLENHPDAGPYYLKKELEEVIFVELTTAFSSSENYRKAVEDASSILKHVSEKSAVDLPIAVPAEFRRDPPSILP
ncbi:hypothetical protein ACIQUG_03490 [Ensifer sp. NPDC090286]|uniref:hypothetical protein n=1 Tax=Ensifer sp. NPDC090286 TaxID=3363991 RepID=UPI00383B5AD6